MLRRLRFCFLKMQVIFNNVLGSSSHILRVRLPKPRAKQSMKTSASAFQNSMLSLLGKLRSVFSNRIRPLWNGVSAPKDADSDNVLEPLKQKADLEEECCGALWSLDHKNTSRTALVVMFPLVIFIRCAGP
jgi:hypothetical protein